MNTAVDYERPRAQPTLPDPADLTAPRGTVPDFGGGAHPKPHFAMPSSHGQPDQIPDHTCFAFEVAKHKQTFIYFGPSPATSTPSLPPPQRSTTFAMPAVPPTTARRSTPSESQPHACCSHSTTRAFIITCFRWLFVVSTFQRLRVLCEINNHQIFRSPTSPSHA
jgi:hypothetical protein